jgi:hypothetical protein
MLKHKELLETIVKITAFGAGFSYFAGLLIINFYLVKFGFHEFSLLNVRYALPGLVAIISFTVLFASIYFFVEAIINLFTGEKDFREETRPLTENILFPLALIVLVFLTYLTIRKDELSCKLGQIASDFLDLSFSAFFSVVISIILIYLIFPFPRKKIIREFTRPLKVNYSSKDITQNIILFIIILNMFLTYLNQFSINVFPFLPIQLGGSKTQDLTLSFKSGSSK